MPKEGQLESEAAASRVAKVPGVIPPFGLKRRMIEVVPRKVVGVTWQCRFEVRCSEGYRVVRGQTEPGSGIGAPVPPMKCR